MKKAVKEQVDTPKEPKRLYTLPEFETAVEASSIDEAIEKVTKGKK